MDIAFFERSLREANFAESSVFIYVHCVRFFLETDPDLGDIAPYNEFIIKHSIKKRNTHYYSILKKFIQWKITDKKLQHNMIDNLIRPPIREDIKRERKYLTEDNILEVINSLEKPKHRIIAIIQNLTGVRAGDVLRLREGQIVPEEYKGKPVLRLNITGKRKKRAVVFLHDKVAQELVWTYIMNNPGIRGYYFVNDFRIKIKKKIVSDFNFLNSNYAWYYNDMKQALLKNGIHKEDFATHDLRRCFARRVWERYKDIHVLQGLLHHKNADTTLRYLAQSGMKNIEYLEDMQTN